VQVSSSGGVIAFPSLGLYSASKWALEGLTEALAAEVAGFGIKTTLIEPSAYSTDGPGISAVRSDPNPLYQLFRDAVAIAMDPATLPAPNATVDAVLAAIDAEQPPTRLVLGSSTFDQILPAYERRLKTWRDWETDTVRRRLTAPHPQPLGVRHGPANTITVRSGEKPYGTGRKAPRPPGMARGRSAGRRSPRPGCRRRAARQGRDTRQGCLRWRGRPRRVRTGRRVPRRLRLSQIQRRHAEDPVVLDKFIQALCRGAGKGLPVGPFADLTLQAADSLSSSPSPGPMCLGLFGLLSG